MTDPDSADLDALQELVRSPGFQLYAARINEELERRRAELETAEKLEAIKGSQGLIKGLRIALEIPGILIEEVKAQL